MAYRLTIKLFINSKAPGLKKFFTVFQIQAFFSKITTGEAGSRKVVLYKSVQYLRTHKTKQTFNNINIMYMMVNTCERRRSNNHCILPGINHWGYLTLVYLNESGKSLVNLKNIIA